MLTHADRLFVWKDLRPAAVIVLVHDTLLSVHVPARVTHLGCVELVDFFQPHASSLQALLHFDDRHAALAFHAIHKPPRQVAKAHSAVPELVGQLGKERLLGAMPAESPFALARNERILAQL